MNIQNQKPEPGLYFISTPIGAARDITLRALDLLRAGDVLVAEDTRTLKHLMQIHGISVGDRPVLAYHEHSLDKQRLRLMGYLSEGKSVIYASEAGTPLVADPGFQLSRAAIAEGHRVHAAPGPSAVLAALTVSGLPSDRFLFGGFLPSAKGARAKAIQELAAVPATLILYESPKRVQKLLAELSEYLGSSRQAVVCRELTKKFEEVSRGSLEELQQHYADRAVKGEIVVLIDRPSEVAVNPEDVEGALRAALQSMSVKDAAAHVAASTGLKKRDLYQLALGLENDDG